MKMIFKINGKEYELKFGMKLARVLDQTYKIDYQGMEFGMGVNMALMNLKQMNPVAIQEVITAGLSHLTSIPKPQLIESAIENYAEENAGLEELFEELADEMGKSPTLKATIKNFKESAVVESPEEN